MNRNECVCPHGEMYITGIGVSESGQLGYGLPGGCGAVLPVAVSLARGGENIRDVTARFASSLLTERIGV